MDENNVLEKGVVEEVAKDYEFICNVLVDTLDKMVDGQKIAETNLKAGMILGVIIGAGSVGVGCFTAKKIQEYLDKKKFKDQVKEI